MIDLFADLEPAPVQPRLPHVLVVSEDHIEVEHPAECPQVEQQDGHVLAYHCGVAWELDNYGMSEFFRPDEEDMTGGGATVLIPGRYLIEWHQEVYRHPEYPPEYDSWIRLLYPEEAQR